MNLKEKLSYGAISYAFLGEIVSLDDWAHMTSQRSVFISSDPAGGFAYTPESCR
jgi:hypothetical protein